MNQDSGAPTAVETPNPDHEVVAQFTPVEPAPAEAPKVEADSDSKNPQDNEDQGDKAKPKRRGGFQKKIERLESENERLRALAYQTPQIPNEADNATKDKPTRNNYLNDDDFLEALAEFKAEQVADKKLSERDRQTADTKSKQERDTKAKSYKAQAEEARKVYADFDEVMAEYDDVPVNPAIHTALLDSEMGPEVAYHLAKNPEEFDRLNAPNMDLASVSRAIGRIEAKIEAGKNSGVKVAEVKTTQAPAPITPVKSKAQTANSPEAAAAAGDYEAYKKARGFK